MTNIILAFDYDHVFTIRFYSLLSMSNIGMNTLNDSTLATELQKLYLKNDELRSDFIFLEEEMLFCWNLFNHVLSEKVEKENLPKIEMIRSTLNIIFGRRRKLTDSLQYQECELAKLSAGESMEIWASMNKNADDIINEILLLCHAKKLIKEDLWELFKRQQLNKLPILKATDLNKRTQSNIML